MKTGILLGRALMLFISLTLLVSCKDNDSDERIKLNETSLNMNVGETKQLTVTPSGKTVTWTSSNDDVAVVDQNGLVTAVDNGEATITARVGNQEAKCLVTVAEVFITLNKNEASLWIGQTEQLEATVEPEGVAVTWESSDDAIVTVDENGLVTAVAEGTATISAVIGSTKAECVFTVTIPQVTVWTVGNKATKSGTPQPHIIKIYKNDEHFVDVTDGTANAIAESMFVDGDKIYVGGFWGKAAALWTIDANTKAITLKELTNGTYSAYVKSVFAANGKVYAGGYELISGVNQPRYWIDGVQQPDLERAGTTNSMIYSIFVDGNDLYLGGTDGISGVMWKNREYSVIQAGVTGSSVTINGLTVYNGDVYAVGVFGTNSARIWKNGQMTTLPSPKSKATPFAVTVSEGNIYVAGSEVVDDSGPLNKIGGGVWKNSEHLWTLWDETSSTGSARGIAVVDGDVYIVGNETRGKGQLMVWKNGQELWQLTDFTDFATTGYGIAVIKK